MRYTYTCKVKMRKETHREGSGMACLRICRFLVAMNGRQVTFWMCVFKYFFFYSINSSPHKNVAAGMHTYIHDNASI